MHRTVEEWALEEIAGHGLIVSDALLVRKARSVGWVGANLHQDYVILGTVWRGITLYPCLRRGTFVCVDQPKAAAAIAKLFLRASKS